MSYSPPVALLPLSPSLAATSPYPSRTLTYCRRRRRGEKRTGEHRSAAISSAAAIAVVVQDERDDKHEIANALFALDNNGGEEAHATQPLPGATHSFLFRTALLTLLTLFASALMMSLPKNQKAPR